MQKRVFTLYLGDDIIEYLQAVAEAEDRSVSQLIRHLLRKAIMEKSKEPV